MTALEYIIAFATLAVGIAGLVISFIALNKSKESLESSKLNLEEDEKKEFGGFVFSCLGKLTVFVNDINKYLCGFNDQNINELRSADKSVNYGFEKMLYYGRSIKNKALQVISALNVNDPKYKGFSLHFYVARLMTIYFLYRKSHVNNMDKDIIKSFESLFKTASTLCFENTDIIFEDKEGALLSDFYDSIKEFGYKVEDLNNEIQKKRK